MLKSPLMNSNQKLGKILVVILVVALPSISVLGQSCTTGKLDQRVADFLKKYGAGQTMAQLKAAIPQQLKSDIASAFTKLPDDSVKRIVVTKDKIKVNVVKASSKTKLTVIVNFHPGGFIKPLLPSMEYEAMRLAKKFNAVVFDVDYRTAPEFKFPTASSDAYNAYLWVQQHASEYGGDPTKIILSGSGEGANLAALVTHRAKKEGKLAGLKCVIMICPPVDNPIISYYASYDDNAIGYGLTKDEMLFSAQSYLEKSQWFMTNPETWPIYEKDFAGLPPSVIITSEFDVLRDEGIAYGKKLEKAGNDVSILCYPHQVHNFVGLPADAAEMKQLNTTIADVVTKALAK
jgi:acetyl esterase